MTTSPQLNIGVVGRDHLKLDVYKLLDTRCLVAGNSGAGKSWLLRLMAEQLIPVVPTIVIDPESEFVTLREKFDVVLGGEGGEVPVDPRSAALLARRLVELNVSAVLNINGLNLRGRRDFVRNFLESLLDLPKALWRPTAIMLDEAHIFCPEKSAGESVATEAVINLMSLGRKRGFAGILATQRLSKLHKDAEAETNNVFLGRAWMDNDQKRVGALLGFSNDQARGLRDLSQGQFHFFGPAGSLNGVNLVQVGQVKTTHPSARDRRTIVAPKPSAKVKKIASELEDLVQKAEVEVKNLDAAKVEIERLKAEYATLEQAAGPAPVIKQTGMTKAEHHKLLREAVRDAVEKAVANANVKRDKLWAEKLGPVLKHVEPLLQQFKEINVDVAEAAALEVLATQSLEIYEPPAEEVAAPPQTFFLNEQHTTHTPAPVKPKKVQTAAGDTKLGKAELAILAVLSQYPAGCEINKLALLAGYKVGGGFRTRLSTLRTADLIAGENTEVMRITPAGLAQGPFRPLPKAGAPLREYWLNNKRLGKAEKAVIMVLAQRPAGLTIEPLATAAGYEVGGGFRTRLSTLRTAGLIVGANTEVMKLAPNLLSA